MGAQSSQIQLKLSLSQQLNDLLASKAARLGIPVTQFVKHLIIKEVEEEYPTFQASDDLERKTKEALEEYDKAVTVDAKDLKKFFEDL